MWRPRSELLSPKSAECPNGLQEYPLEPHPIDKIIADGKAKGEDYFAKIIAIERFHEDNFYFSGRLEYNKDSDRLYLKVTEVHSQKYPRLLIPNEALENTRSWMQRQEQIGQKRNVIEGITSYLRDDCGISAAISELMAEKFVVDSEIDSIDHFKESSEEARKENHFKESSEEASHFKESSEEARKEKLRNLSKRDVYRSRINMFLQANDLLYSVKVLRPQVGKVEFECLFDYQTDKGGELSRRIDINSFEEIGPIGDIESEAKSAIINSGSHSWEGFTPECVKEAEKIKEDFDLLMRGGAVDLQRYLLENNRKDLRR